MRSLGLAPYSCMSGNGFHSQDPLSTAWREKPRATEAAAAAAAEKVLLSRAWSCPARPASRSDSSSAEHVGSHGLICQMAPGGDDLLGAESSLINFTASPQQKTGGSKSPAQAALMESAVTKEQSIIYDCL